MTLTSTQALSERLNFFVSAPAAVPATNSLYVSHALREIAGRKEITLVGMNLTLDESSDYFRMLHTDPGELLAPSAPTVKLNSVLIVCDVLEINAPLRLPECDVTIHARELKFGRGAFLDTSPLAWAKDTATKASRTPGGLSKGEDGKDGRHAGAINVWVGNLEHPKDEMDGGLAMRRFRACGGNGQHPGQGEDGNAGHRVYVFKNYSTSFFNEYFVGTTENKANLKFDPPAVYVAYTWKALVINADSDSYGTAEWPTSGQDALEPGAPGEPGNAGQYTSNRAAGDPALYSLLPGKAGRNGAKVQGGAKGWPDKCAHYQCKLTTHPWNEYDTGYSCEKTENPNAPLKDGASFAEKKAKSQSGKSPAPKLLDSENAWLHPLLLPCMLNYLRDAYLSQQYGSVRKLLDAYGNALSGKLPGGAAGTAWANGEAKLKWRAAQCEIAVLRQRLDAQLDYFGNPPGFMPLFSLQGTLRNYRNEIDSALRTLMLSNWIKKRADANQDLKESAWLTMKQLNENTKQIAEKVPDLEKQVADLGKRFNVVESQQQALQRKIGAQRKKLEDKARADEEFKAQMRFAVNMASALCYVIPYGQPILGAAGDFAGGLAEKFIDSDGAEWNEQVADGFAEAGKQWTSSWKDYQKGVEDAEKVAKTAADDAEKAAKRDGKDKEFKQANWEDEKKKAKGEVDRWGTALDGLGPALGKVSKGISALRVSETKVAAQLAKLEKVDPEFEKLTKELRELLEKKQSLAVDLAKLNGEMGRGYAQMSANASTVLSLGEDLGAAARKFSPESVMFMNQLGQGARHALVEALYNVVRAYEASVFSTPPSVPWNLDSVYDKISELLADKGDKFADALLKQDEIRKVFSDQVVGRFAKALLNDYRMGEGLCLNLEYGLSERKLSRLNANEVIVIDPMRKGLIPHDRQRAFIDKIELPISGLAFSEPLPKSGNALIKLSVAGKGVVRYKGKLYCVQSKANREWVWTYQFSSGTLTESHPSRQSEDLLDLVLEGAGSQSAASLRQKLAMPPAWSDVKLEVSYPGVTAGKIAPLRKLTFNFWIDSLPVLDDEVVLEWRCDDPKVPMHCSPRDTGGLPDGYTQYFGIYPRNSQVTLAVEGNPAEWYVPAEIGVSKPKGGKDVASDHSGFSAYLAPEIEISLARHTKIRTRCG